MHQRFHFERVLFRLFFSQTTNFRLFQTERLCRRQLKCDENRRRYSKRIENTVGKGEIARYEQFLLFPQCFQRVVLETHQNQGLDCFKLKDFADDNFKFDANGRNFFKRVENTVAKGEIARYENLLLLNTVSIFKRLYCRHVKTRAYTISN